YFVRDGLTKGIVCGNHHFGDEVIGTRNRMHFTHFIESDELIGDLTHPAPFYFDENVGEAHAKLPSTAHRCCARLLHRANNSRQNGAAKCGTQSPVWRGATPGFGTRSGGKPWIQTAAELY